jgi:arylformamidase
MHQLDLNRRSFLAGTAALTAMPIALSSTAGAEAVFLNYSQAELDRNYDQAPWSPNRDKVQGRLGVRNQLVRELLGPERHQYGDKEIEGLDLYRTHTENAPIHIFIHGGAWRVGSAAGSAFHAPKYVTAGAHFVALDFDNVMDAGLDGMVDQVRRGIVWVYENADSFGGDRDRIYISGFSSGGHLAGVMLITDWESLGVPADAIKGAICISGMYDLEPVRLSKRSEYVPFTDEIEHEFSAMRHLETIKIPVLVACGEFDTDEFRRQSQEFADALKDSGNLQGFMVVGGYNHFELQESFADPFSVLGHEGLKQMGLQYQVA